ncbi:centriole, cilia and spindle-associated protein [Gallus gallus]|uniref:centriole, cilia and spindle-associated protein n=1 Tax=Gallus gallus TaxID=9031 RepID=UPI0000E800E8|nr:centriole, cilia and spindle-associated protein [Gallus gallus]XP_040523790.1 centriole, cilia and spindle-associated protein [Gallus gallus]|eukprot:XP_015139877.1 centriole, cilia and spindle-associated protein [Gallus gallus]
MVVPARRVKTEYMKRFKEPKWESCGACYLELLRYRLSRRLLEQAHRPWLWDGWEQDSAGGSGSSTAGSPSPPGAGSPPPAQEEEAAEAGGGEAGRAGPEKEKERQDQEKHQKEEQEKTVEHTSTKEADKTSTKEADKTSRTGRRPSQSALSSRNDRRSAKSPQKTDAPKENKHPFALYGWGERQTDTGSQKTHNVCASASVNEIHESALRAKNRRQVEKRKLSQRRVRSAEAEKAWRIKPSPPDNPWMTEYMRCYSARAR